MDVFEAIEDLCDRQSAALDGVARAIRTAAKREARATWDSALKELQRAARAHGERPGFPGTPGPTLDRLARAARAFDKAQREGREMGLKPALAFGREAKVLDAARRFAQGWAEVPWLGYQARAFTTK